MKVQIFDKKTLESIEWPSTTDGNYAQRFLTDFIKNGADHYIDNINASLLVLKIDNLVLPIVVVNNNYDNSYVCSPYGHYIATGLQSLNLIENPILRTIAKPPLHGIGYLGKMGQINSVVYVNNWLFSTDLYPAGISSNTIATILGALIDRFPEHAIVFRSLNPITTPNILLYLKELGFHLIPSRQIYMTDSKDESIFETRILKSDLKLWKENPYEVLDETQISHEEGAELLTLYNKLYLSQHTFLNPQLNPSFMQLIFDQQLLKFKILKSEGVIEGVVGHFERDGIMMSPFIGFDKMHEKHTLIYRVLCTALLLEARESGAILHQSAGGSFFKKIRRAESCIEFMAVYTRHLTRKKQFCWGVLKHFIKSFAIPYMEKY